MVGGVTMSKQVWISDEAYEYVRKWAFDSKEPMGKLISRALLNNISDQEEQRK
jgi:AmiR/NasT family two-component response regulator